jgi:N6-L-threonylcarbamoyladenine synthase
VTARGLILGIETSCDETAAAVVERGARTLSSVVASQIATHARYGGVVPELASREHVRAIVPVVRTALEQAQIALSDLDAIAVTAGPGLAGALLVGITYAKALAYANRLPLIAVNHLEGHIHAVLLQEREKLARGTLAQGAKAELASHPCAMEQRKDRAPARTDPQVLRLVRTGGLAQDDIREEAEEKPALALVVSGGHTHLFLAQPRGGSWKYRLIGRTVDDAAGEAYDKVAKLLGLGYPGGPWIDALAGYGNPQAVPFAFAQVKAKAHLAGKTPRTKGAKTAPIARLDPRFLFSFSGIKTAVLRHVELNGLRIEARRRVERLFPREDAGEPRLAKIPGTREEALVLCSQATLDLLASFQHAVVGDLMKKTFAAAESLGARWVLVTGGVAANRELRARFTREAAERSIAVSFPTPALSTDNAAMIAAAAWPRLLAHAFAPTELTADPSLALS